MESHTQVCIMFCTIKLSIKSSIAEGYDIHMSV